MNILPLVSAFLLVFSFGAYTFFTKAKASHEETHFFVGSLNAQRKVTSKFTRKAYSKLKGSSLEERPKKSPSPSQGEKPYPSPRETLPPPPTSRLSIAALLNENEEHLELRQTAVRLLETLYEFIPNAPDPEETLQALISAARRSRARTLEDLLPELPPYFYRLTKGTQSYTPRTTDGIPPLGDYLTFEEHKSKKPIIFSHASAPVLGATFGPIIAPQIIGEERRKWEERDKKAPLTEGELSLLLARHNKTISDFASSLYFLTTSTPQTAELITDAGTNIHLRAKVPKKTGA